MECAVTYIAMAAWQPGLQPDSWLAYRSHGRGSRDTANYLTHLTLSPSSPSCLPPSPTPPLFLPFSSPRPGSPA